MENGHYTAARVQSFSDDDPEESPWYLIDDDKVFHASYLQVAKTEDIYLLLYRRIY